jgi:4-amino-4-deoxy-L-arabinose transferase-like glycosyltransferase
MPVPPGSFPRAAAARLLLLLGALALFLPGFFSLPPTDRDESRFAQASRQMLEDGDYLHIRFQEQDRLNKPAGIYWLQAAAARLAGTGWANPIWPFRLPSLLGALAAVALTAGLGDRLGGRGTGWRAGALLALTVLLGVEARLAKTDAVLLALVVAAQAALWAIYQAHRAHRPVSALAVQGFWLAQAAALLVKGPIALLVSLLTVLALALADRDARLWRALRPGWGALWFAVLVLPWLWAITRASEGAFWHDAVARDLLAKAARGQESHGAPPGTHLLLTPLTLWPAVLLLVPGLAASWCARAEPAARFLLAWALPFWLLFELIPTKLPHYILPAVPALCLMAGMLLTGPHAAAPAWSRWLGRALWVIGALVLSSLTVWLPHAAGEPSARFALAAGAMVLGAAALWALGRRGSALALAGLLPACLVLGLMLPRLDALWPSREVARQLQAQGITAPLIAAGYTEPSLVFWTDRATTLLSDGDAAARRLLREPERPVLVDERREAAFLAALAGAGAGAEPLARIAARDLNGGGPLRLTLYRLAGAAR